MLLGDLQRSGFDVSEEHEGTDAIIVNTCAFVDDAKAESLQVIPLCCPQNPPFLLTN